MRGVLIVIDGTDGSGKETQSTRLLQRLEEEGFLTAYADFPQHGQKSAGMVDNYLNGKYGNSKEVDPKIASIFYAMDRYDASFAIRKSLSEGRVVICNRYIAANMGHQGGKIEDKGKRDEYLSWLEDFEFNLLKIPKPDQTIILYVPYQIAHQLVESKKHREYIINKDIHETDSEHMRKAEQAYLEIAKEKGWVVIDCTRDGKLLPIEEIHQMVWEQTQKILKDAA